MTGADMTGAEIRGLLPPGHYIVVPSRRSPLIVASRDRAVLRYLAASVLSVPPGTGHVLGLPLTIALRAFRPGGLCGERCRR
ncbi:MAG TPA: hypothetical protein VNV62_00670 [Trebonia sp.]|nr:hypothetical protein [Trebonia sp.]